MWTRANPHETHRVPMHSHSINLVMGPVGLLCAGDTMVQRETTGVNKACSARSRKHILLSVWCQRGCGVVQKHVGVLHCASGITMISSEPSLVCTGEGQVDRQGQAGVSMDCDVHGWHGDLQCECGASWWETWRGGAVGVIRSKDRGGKMEGGRVGCQLVEGKM